MKIENRKIRFSIFLIVALKPFLYLFRFIAMNKLEDIIRYEQFDNLEFIASQIVAGFITGLHRSPYHGFSVEFAEHRVYNTGESTKHVDWKLYARTEKLFVKQFEEETNRIWCWILLLRCCFLIRRRKSLSSGFRFIVQQP